MPNPDRYVKIEILDQRPERNHAEVRVLPLDDATRIRIEKRLVDAGIHLSSNQFGIGYAFQIDPTEVSWLLTEVREEKGYG